MRGRRATADDLEFVRELRNHNAQLMTCDTRQISREEQLEWWNAAPRDLWIFEDDIPDSIPVGYALYTHRSGRDFISLCVEPTLHGRGYGTEIYRFRTPVSAEILLDNWPSRRAAEKAGLQVVWMDDTKVLMARW